MNIKTVLLVVFLFVYGFVSKVNADIVGNPGTGRYATSIINPVTGVVVAVVVVLAWLIIRVVKKRHAVK